MAENSAIEWTETTWNPLAGCTRASEGCDNCYAAKMSLRLEAMAERDITDGRDPGGKAKYIGIATKNGKGVAVFNGKINLDMNALHEPISWKKPRMIFVNSMSDLFHKDVPFSFVAQVFETMRLAHWHTFQVLTKRPERMYAFWQWVQVNHISLAAYWPLPNAWLGTSVENQEQADKRIPELLRVPAAVRFLSCEPLLGAIDLEDLAYEAVGPDWAGFNRLIDWVIVGGESGANARPMNIKWVYDIRDQCVNAGVPFFFKQHGEFVPYPEIAEWKADTELMEHYGMSADEATGWVIKPEWKEAVRGNKNWGVVEYDGRFLPQTTTWNQRQLAEEDEWEHTVYRVGKHTAGRLLGGRTWDEFPLVEFQSA